MTISGNAEFGLHVFKRRAIGQKGWSLHDWRLESHLPAAICHDACIGLALAAIRGEMEKAAQSPVALHRTLQASVSDANP